MGIEVTEAVGALIRERRRSLGLTQADLGLRLFCDARQVSRRELGSTAVDVDWLADVAVVLEVDPAALFYAALVRSGRLSEPQA